ncbi:MAG: hypothetical protein JW928_03435 [Candidatus Aureabacteria bacterium]|nr:hypothetical protein [Candidatus Auribacterota bacterium]
MAESSTNKRTTIIHRTQKPVQDLIQLLGEIEITIRELTLILVDLTPSRHIGAGGKEKPTAKQLEIKKQIEAAQKRYNAVLKLLMKG